MQIKKKYIYIALGLWALVTVTYFTLCKIASDQAMLIFNKTMSAQKVLKGSVTLGSIDADIWGRVEFQNLVWLDIDGQPIVRTCAAGTFQGADMGYYYQKYQYIYY